MSPLLRIAITLGDPNGIGPELCLRLMREKELIRHIQPIFYGSEEALVSTAKLLDIQPFRYRLIKEELEANSTDVCFVDIKAPTFAPTPGFPSDSGAVSAFLALKRACAALKLRQGAPLALVTAPLAKASFASEGYHGHTEYLQHYFGAKDSLMMMVGEKMRIVLLSAHVPLSTVPSLVNRASLEAKCGLLFASLTHDFGISHPKVACLGLNPHAGEKGQIGGEEQRILEPFLAAQQKIGRDISGPYPADGFFARNGHENVDATLAMYHDQGLIPFKMLSTDDGVNYTAGLPIIRTSPAHGTAYTLVGRHQAKLGPMRQAISCAVSLVKQRHKA